MGFFASIAFGPLNPKVICSSCGERGKVRVKRERVKAGLSGGKAAGALLTGGLSLLATGLSRHVTVNKAHCGSCDSFYQF
jgi:hypothetical protein